MTPYRILYRLGLTPWERRSVPDTWRPLLEGPDALPPGRALDIGCGTGRDAVHLAGHGWEVSAVEADDRAISKARRRGEDRGVAVQWIHGDVSRLGQLGLEPGYTLIYDFGCIQGLPDSARAGAFAGVGELAAERARLMLFAFQPKRRLILPRGMGQEEITAGLADGWKLDDVRPAVEPSMPAPVRRAGPTLYRLTRSGA